MTYIGTEPTYDARMNCTNTMGVVDGTTAADRIARPGQPVFVVDALSSRFQELLNGINAWREETWTGEKIFTTAWRLCGSENAWLIVLAFNGLGTPMELRPGMILRVPIPEELDRVLKALQPTGGVLGQEIII